MKKETGELDYTVDERLNPMASFKESDENVGGAVEILLVDEKSDEEYEDEIILTDEYSEDFEEMKSFKLECIKIANTIYNMMNNKENPFKVYDKNLDDYRKVEYKDIVILMRSPSSNTKILEEVFLEYNIPIYAESTGGYFDTFEVDTIINLLKIIDNPMQDIPLISVMYSPIYNFTSKELSEIRLVDRELKFYELLIKILEDEQKRRKNKKDNKDKKDSDTSSTVDPNTNTSSNGGSGSSGVTGGSNDIDPSNTKTSASGKSKFMQVRQAIVAAGQKTGIESGLLAAIAGNESGFNPNATGGPRNNSYRNNANSSKRLGRSDINGGKNMV